ncbi:hypothetical protein [Haloarcula quadrata]|nr:hypothetical protein [Haloarcula quadrata]
MDRKQLKLTKSTFEYLSDEASDSVRSVTRGMLLYEMAMMFSDSLTDEIEEKEERVNERLESHTDTSFRCGVDSVKVRNEDGSFPSQSIIDPNDDLTDSLINIYLPVSVQEHLEDEWGQRYWAEKVDDLVIDYIDSAFESRYDRYQCKEDLIAYIEDDEYPDHEVARSIVEGSANRYTTSDLHSVLEEDKWWLAGDLSYNDIIDRAEEEFDSNTPLETKIDVAAEILDRHAEQREMEMPRKLAVSLITKVFNVSESYVENEYLPQIELPDYSGEDEEDGESIDYMERCLNAKEQLVKFLEDNNRESDKDKIERMNAANVCMVEKDDIEELDGLEEQEARNEKIQEIIDKGSKSNTFVLQQQSSIHMELIENLSSELE